MTSRDLGRGRRARRSVNTDARYKAGAAVVQAWSAVVAAVPNTPQRLDAEIVLATCLNELARAYTANGLMSPPEP